MGLYEFTRDDAYRFANEVGAQTRTRGKELQFKTCPYCKSRKDTWTFSIDLDSGQFNCLRASCGAHGNMIALAKEFDFSLGTETDEYYQPRKRYRDIRKHPLPLTKAPAVEYLETRGISQETAKRYSIGTQKDHDNILVIPFVDEKGALTFVKYRKTDFVKGKDRNKEWCEPGLKPILFGMAQCNTDNNTLIITEGQIDSLSVAECGIENAVSVPTGAKGFTWVPYCWDFLCKFKTLIVFGDYENGHITLLDELKRRFNGAVKHVRPEDYRDCKDANELLLKYGKQAVIDAVKNAVPVPNPKIKKLSEVQRKNISQMEHINTGFEQLDRTIGGMYLGQLILLTGERGDGKSTLVSQFGAFAIKQGYSTFFYSGELADWIFQDCLDRQLAGVEHIRQETSDNGFTSYAVTNKSAEYIHSWYEEYAHIYENSISVTDEESQETVIETLENSIKQYGCRVLFVDNLMTAMDDDLKVDIYRQQSNFVKRLSWMAKAYNVLIVLIVHPRKTNGNGFRNDDVAGSSNITNLVDVVMNYSRPKPQDAESNDYDPDPGDRLLQVTKNRLNGQINNKGIKLWYQGESKRISETHSFNWKMGWEPEQKRLPDRIQFAEDYDGEIPF